ncbi:MAG: ATP-binding protein [Lachnospiraceae bacterium]
MFQTTVIIVLMGFVIGTMCCLAAGIQYRKMEHRRNLLEVQVNMENQHYMILEKQLEQNGIYLAEIEKQIELMDRCISSGNSRNPGLLRECRDNLLETKKKLSMEKYCTNPVINAVFHHKKEECREKNIQIIMNLSLFQCDFVKEVDMVGILYNLFDNAIEACCQLEDEKERFLTVTCENRERENVLEFTNSRNPAFDPERKGNGKTWKKDIENHGLGLEILEKLVKKYQGTLAFERLPDRFHVTISFPAA